MFLERLSFGSKEYTEEMEMLLECASFLGLTWPFKVGIQFKDVICQCLNGLTVLQVLFLNKKNIRSIARDRFFFFTSKPKHVMGTKRIIPFKCLS